MCNNEAEKAKNDPLGFELRTFVAFQLFMKIAAKVMTTMAMIISGDEFDVHDNADF